MRITAQEEYGLRCILQIARHTGDAPVAISEIAKAEGLSTQYVAKLLNRLHRANLLASHRGIRGGFRLTRRAEAISIGDVLEALGGALQRQRKGKALCESFVGNRPQCVHLSNCSIRPLWFVIMRHVTEVLHRLTLQDLLDEEAGSSQTIERHFRETTDHRRGLGVPLPTHPGGTHS